MRLNQPAPRAALLFLLLTIPAPAARALVPPEPPYVHGVCTGISFKDYEGDPGAPFAALPESGHQAHFELLSAPGAPAILTWAGYSYEDSRGRRQEASRTSAAFEPPLLKKITRDVPGAGGYLPGDPHGLLGPRYKTFVSSPERGGPQYAGHYETFSLPASWGRERIPERFPLVVKLFAADESSRRRPTALWSKLYRAECVSTILSEKEFDVYRATWAHAVREPPSRMHRDLTLDAVWPEAHARWRSLGEEERKVIYKATLAAAATGAGVLLARAARSLLEASGRRALAMLGPLGAWLALTAETNAQETLAGRLTYREVDRFLLDQAHARLVLATSEYAEELLLFYRNLLRALSGRHGGE